MSYSNHSGWQPRLKQIKSCNNKFTFNPETFEAFSYGWWKFVMKVKGKIIFNNHHYSNTTRNHQWEMRSILEANGESIYLEVDCPRGLQRGLDSEILNQFYYKIGYLKAELENPKTKNKEDRLASIESLKQDIKKAKALGYKITKQKIADLTQSAKDDYIWELKAKAEKREREKAEKRAKMPAVTQLLLKIKDHANNQPVTLEQKILDAINAVSDAVKKAA